jgi:two-component system OmpR family sensor kinase
MRAYLGVQVRRADDVFGVLEVMRSQATAFSYNQEQLLQALADAAAIAVHNARLVQQQVEHARREEATRVRQGMLLAIAHDLKTPVSVVQSYAALARRQLAPDASPGPRSPEASLVQIERAASQMADMLEQLGDLACLEAGQPLPLALRRTDLVRLVQDAVTGHQVIFPGETVQLVSDLDKLAGWWDAPRLRRVLDNLLSNAAKYSPGTADISVSVSRVEREGDAWATVSVEDRGRGIPAEDLPHVFELFARGRNVTRKVAGTGIGLANARAIIEQHGGRITLASQEGVGTRVLVELPIRGASGRGDSPTGREEAPTLAGTDT